MGRPQQVTDAEILATARALFLEHGPGLPTQVIADKLGVSQAAVFKRFKTKRQLLAAALMPPERHEWIELLQRGPDASDIKQQLREIARLAAAYLERMVPSITVLRAAGMSIEQVHGEPSTSPPAAGQRALSMWLARAIAQGRIRQADPEQLALMFMGALHIRPYLRHLTGDTDLSQDMDRYIDALNEVFWSGVAPQEPPPAA